MDEGLTSPEITNLVTKNASLHVTNVVD